MKHSRSQSNQKHRRKNQEEYRKDQLDTDLSRGFLRLLAQARAKVLGMGSQSGRQAGTEPVAFDQKVGQLLQLGVAAGNAEPLQRVSAALAGPQPEIDLGHLFAQIGMGVAQFQTR